MGGNALKNCVTHRLDAEDYEDIRLQVLYRLKTCFPGRHICAVEAYANKVDFGDLDVVVSYSELDRGEVTKEILEAVFNSKEVVQNGSVYSFEFQEFQVDLILEPTHLFACSLNYFAYNDLGNLMGRIAHKMGFKYGDMGLVYMFRTSDDHVTEEITLSTNSADIFTFLGYNWETFLNEGFSEMEDIFEFVVSTPYFNKEIYLLENRNATSRVRDKKRKTYSAFLEWLEEPRVLPEHPWPSMEERGGRKDSEHLERAFKVFPKFKEDFDTAAKVAQERNEFKQRYNGELVSQWTGLTNQALGEFMRFMRNFGQCSIQGSIQEYLKAKPIEKIEQFVKEQFSIFNTFKQGIIIK